MFMKISLTSGKAEGPTKLNAFDNALLNAGIGDINLIKVSSIIPAGAEFVALPQFKAGSMVNTVLSYIASDQEGDFMSAVIVVAISDDLGCVVEHSGINRDLKEVKDEAEAMAEYMMDVRGKQTTKVIVEFETHKVKKQGAVVAAVVYIDDFMI
jgi:arginine decarboxylase